MSSSHGQGGQWAGFPHNGTAYIPNAHGDSLSGARSGSHFGLFSVDLAEFNTLYPDPWTVQFIGYKSDGTSVTTEFTTDGIIDGMGPLPDFQTFNFNERFADLVRFEVPSQRQALDNLVFFDTIPEPSASSLQILGVAIIAGRRLLR